jgi:integrase
MRIPNYLYLAPSGVWHFRQRLPSHVVRKTGRKEVKRSLRTRDLLTAQQRALNLVQAYAQAFTVRGLNVFAARDGLPSVDEIAKAIALGYRVLVKPDGTIEIEATGKEDHSFAMDAVDRIGVLAKEPYYQEFIRAEAQRLVDQAQASSVALPAPASNIPSIAIGKAVTQWLAEIKSSTRPKTFKIKTTAVEGFARHYGEKNPLKDAQRIDVGNWVMALRASKLETPTIVNKCSYLRGFFDWAKARGYYPSFAKDENPASGQIVFGTREKRARRAFGFKAFSDDQVCKLFDAKALEGLSEAACWGAWIGLYTGARVAEVGQLTLADFIEVDGIPCIRICDEGEGQSVKSEVSIRTIPVHPKLVELGLLKRVAELRKDSQKRLFPKVKVGGVNGPGNWLSKAFSRHIEANVGKPEKGKFGFHSLRKTVVQGLQGAGVTAELRAAYVGHELDDEHHGAYSRAPTMKELLEAVSKLDWSIT